MKIHHYLFFGLISAVILMPLVCGAAVMEVTLFPHVAKVSETTRLVPQCASDTCRAVITLPPQADPESFVISTATANRIKIDDIQIKPVPHQDEARIAELRRQLTAAEDQRKDIKAKIQALEAQAQFWQAQTKTKPKTLPDSFKLADAIGRNIQKLHQDKLSAEAQLDKIEKVIKKLQDEINQAAGKKESAWEATLALSGNTQKEITLSYTYLLGGCGWLPLYRLEALPGEKKIVFSWDAEVWQSSGSDWKQVQVNLATLQPRSTVEPPMMPDWIIQPRILYKTSRAKAVLSAPQEDREALSDEEALTAPAVEAKKTTYSIWSLGKKTIVAGDRQRFTIKDESWKADFLFLARPAMSPEVFLQAEVKLAEPVEIPPGQAVLVIDGAVLGKREFAFDGTEGVLFFGTTPLVTVTSTTLARQSGAKTLFQDKQTKSWQWLIEAKNSGYSNIKLRIEEPIPQARDKRIALSFKQIPEPAEKDPAKFIWLLDVPAGQKKTITNTIELEAPADMNLDFGWR